MWLSHNSSGWKQCKAKVIALYDDYLPGMAFGKQVLIKKFLGTVVLFHKKSVVGASSLRKMDADVEISLFAIKKKRQKGQGLLESRFLMHTVKHLAKTTLSC